MPDTEQHYRVTLTDAIAHYQRGDLTAKGLLHFYLKIRLAKGWVLRESQVEICQKLGISRPAFYSAISRLKAEGAINWSVPGKTRFSIALVVCECRQESANVDSESTIVDSESTIVDSESTIVDSESRIVDSKCLEPLPTKDSSTSPYSSSDSYQLFLTSLSDLVRGGFEKFCFKKIEECSFKIGSPQSWIKKYYLEYWEEFSKKYPEAAGATDNLSNKENFTLDDLKRMYPSGWEEAAKHFGIEFEKA